MIPYFKHKGILAALDEIEKSKVVDVSKYPKGIVEDLKGYDESVFFFYGYHPFVFVDNAKDQNKSGQQKIPMQKISKKSISASKKISTKR